VVNGDGETCARATGTLPATQATAPSLDSYPVVPLPAERRPPTPEALAGLVLGSVEVGFHADRADETLAELGDDHALYRDLGVAHPAWFLRQANLLLMANVALGPWIHTGSEVANLGLLATAGGCRCAAGWTPSSNGGGTNWPSSTSSWSPTEPIRSCTCAT